MPDLRKIVHANMKAVIDWYGCFDAAAETINARWGGGASKGTLSRKLSGSLDFTVPDVIALEDAAQRFPVTKLLARRLESRSNAGVGCLIAQSGAIAKECGEAISVILSAEQSSCADETADAIKEIDEAIGVLKEARGILEARKYD
jgi:hypothetical protein